MANLIKSIANEIKSYFRYIKSLQNHVKPDYKYLKKIFISYQKNSKTNSNSVIIDNSVSVFNFSFCDKSKFAWDWEKSVKNYEILSSISHSMTKQEYLSTTANANNDIQKM